MKICVIRHGETEWNKKGIRQGRKDIPLNREGVIQAEKMGGCLTNNTWKKIISSPLTRAKQTAAIISHILGLGEVELDGNLVERAYGSLEGKNYEIPIEQGVNVEAEEEALQRFEKAIYDAIKKYYPEDIIIVSHGCVIKMLLEKITGESYNTHIKNGNIQMFSFDGGQIEVMKSDNGIDVS